MSSKMNETTEDYQGAKELVEILELAYLISVAVMTVLGNCLVIIAFLRGVRTSRTYTSYYVVNLAFTDLMVGALSLPFWIVYRFDSKLVDETVYKAVFPLDVLTGVTSIMCLALISIERLLAIKFPFIYSNMKSNIVFLLIFITWLIGISLSLPMYIGLKSTLETSIYTATIFTIGFAMPLFIIIISYYCLLRSSMTKVKKISVCRKISRERDLRVAKTISLVILLFFISWCPFFIVNMVYVFCRHCSRPKWPIYVSKMMHYSNSTMNFIVYSIKIPDFRNFYRDMICAEKKREKNSQESCTSRERKTNIAVLESSKELKKLRSKDQIRRNCHDALIWERFFLSLEGPTTNV